MKRTRLAARRKAMGLSQERLADALRIDRSTVIRWERGETTPQPWFRPRLATALKVSPTELERLLAESHNVASGNSPRGVQSLPTILAPSDLAAMRSFRLADRQVGGRHLYDRVTGYLQQAVAPRLFAQATNSEATDVLTAAAGLTEMAGWMAHDAGLHKAAKQHFHIALGFAQAGSDHQLSAHILGSLSHLSHHSRRTDEALAFAAQGLAVHRVGTPHPGVRAKLHMMTARGHAARHESKEAVEHIRQAEAALGRAADDGSPWVSVFDEAALAAEAVRCHRSLGHLEAAQAQAKEVIALRPRDRARSRAFAQMAIVSVLTVKRLFAEACVQAQEVVDATRTVSSYLIVEQLGQLRDNLVPQRAIPEVAAFLDGLEHELYSRQWLAPATSRSNDMDACA